MDAINLIVNRAVNAVTTIGLKEMSRDAHVIYEAAKKELQHLDLMPLDYSHACRRVLDAVEDAILKNGGKL